MLVDSHCHLDYLERDGDLDAAIERARAAGVRTMLTIGTRVSTFPEILAIAERYDDVWCSVGVHPHEAEGEGDTAAAQLVELARHPKVIGIGETGLDYYYDNSPREAQQRSFRSHIAAARETGLPLIVHSRDADDDTIGILRDEHRQGAFPGVIHCFSSTRELAENAVDLGLYVSLAGILTFKNAQDIRDTVRGLPADRLLVETDAPYLAPIPHRGKRNEPAFVAHTARLLGELTGLGAEGVAETTTRNFFRLFSRATAPQDA
ncbi:MAG: TatD family hydrolase [Alphaproteobacteria bacterium]